MPWHGETAFGDAALAFRGESAENRFHAHAAVQCVYAADGLELLDAGGHAHRGTGWAIRSGVTHALQPSPRLVLVLIEPQSRLARGLLQRIDDAPIAALPEDVARLLAGEQPVASLLHALEQHVVGAVPPVDPRLIAALAHLDHVEARAAATLAAGHAGISVARLRALCRSQFGVPFSKLVLWRKVRRACLAMGAGCSLAQAAAEAGFADQAHLTRTMADVIGLTAGKAAAAGA